MQDKILANVCVHEYSRQGILTVRARKGTEYEKTKDQSKLDILERRA